MLALLGLLAVAGYQNRDKLGENLGNITGGGDRPQPLPPAGARTQPSMPAAQQGSGGLGDIFGNLGNLFGGGATAAAASGGVAGAIGDLLNQFSDHGKGNTARSWVETGPNSDVGPDELEEALGEDTVQELQAKTGLSRDELLRRLTSVLPKAVDGLTPEGRLPTRDEEARWASRM
jgi:uncharacterized protein YidB (DUF937 family)